MKKIIDILSEIRPEFDFLESSNFIEDGYLDSFDMITLVADLEKEYGVKVKGIDIIPENFSNVPAICELLQRYGVKDEI